MSDVAFLPPGPLLTGLLEVQELEAKLVAFGELERVADAAIRRADEVKGCVVWPIGAAAERVAAAVTIRGQGRVEVGTWNMSVQGRRLLLLTLAAVSPIEIELAAEQLRRRGASEVHACGVRVTRGEQARGVDSYRALTLRPRRALRAVGDAA
jgi:hypothetical protein